MSYHVMSVVATIAVRYSAVRRQGEAEVGYVQLSGSEFFVLIIRR